MIIDQLFTPKPLEEGGPYDLPGKDYDRPGDTPRKQSSGEHNPYPYSPEEDDDHFREIFRKKREAAAKDQGMAEATAAPTAGVPAPGVAKPAIATQPATAPAQDPSQPYLDKLGARAGAAPGSNITQVTDAYQQKLLDRMGKRFGLPPGSTADQVQAAQQAYLNKNDPTAAAQYKQNMTNIDAGNTAANKPVQLAPKPAPTAAPATAATATTAAPAAAVDPSVEQKVIDDIAKGQGLPAGMTRDELMAAWKKKVTGQFAAPAATPAQPVAEGADRAVNDKGLTQHRWLQLVQTKFPTAKIVQAKMIDGPCRATLPDGRTLSWTKVDQGVAEGKRNKQRKLNEAWLMEDPIYRRFKRVGRYISEQKLTEPEILQIFSDAETGMTDKATGANRTFAGKGKDATVDFAKDVAGAVSGVLNSIQNSVPVAAVDVAYDQATDALGELAGGQKGAVMDAIKKYRNLVKEYPKTAGFAKAALVAVAGLATGGAGLPAIAGLTYALDSAIKGDKLSSVIGKGAGAAALAAAGQGIHGGATQPGTGGPADTSAFTNVNQMGDYTGDYVNMPDGSDAASALVAPAPDLATYTVQQGDTLSQIAQANDTTVQELVGLNPQLAQASGATGGQGLNPDVIFPGQQITLPPGTSGADVYAGGVGTNANTMADIAKGQVPDSAITQGMSAKGQASADAVSGRADNLASMTQQAGGAPIDYTQAGPMSTDSLGQKLEYGIPVNDNGSFVPPSSSLPADELAKQTAAYNSWKSDFMKRFPEATPGPDGSMLKFKPGLNTMQIFNKPELPAAVQESVKFRIIPASRLIDQKATVLNWALNESVGRRSRSVNLTTIGTYTVFENVERYRRALLEYAGGTQPGRPELPDQYRPDMPGGAGVKSEPGMIGRGLNWLDKKVGQVGGALSNFGHQFTTNVTKEKLKMNWHQAGKPSDSDQLAAWLIGQGVPQEVVTSVFSKMGIPYTAPPAQPTAQPAAQTAAPKTGGASTQAYAGINPATKKPWTQQELRDKFYPEPAADSTASTDTAQPPAATATSATAKPAAGTFPGEDPQGPGYVGRREVARRQAARDAEAAKKPAAPNFAQQGGGYKSVNYAPNIKTGINLPRPTAPAKPASTATASKGGLDKKTQDYINAINAKQPESFAENRIAAALKRPVAEMLQMVETKEDVQRIKQFVDDTFIKYGAVNESAFALRNQILEHVTQAGAQRRREHSQRVAH